MTQYGSYATFGQARIPMLQSETTDTALQQHMRFVTADVAFRMPMSQFSFSTPNSNVTAQRGSWGHNIKSTASAVWFKQSGDSNIGWVAIA